MTEPQPKPGREPNKGPYDHIRSRYSPTAFQAMEQAGALARSYKAAAKWLSLMEQVEASKVEVEVSQSALEAYPRDIGEEAPEHLHAMHAGSLHRAVAADLEMLTAKEKEDDHERAMRVALESKIDEAKSGFGHPLSHLEMYSLIRDSMDIAGLPNPRLEKFLR